MRFNPVESILTLINATLKFLFLALWKSSVVSTSGKSYWVLPIDWWAEMFPKECIRHSKVVFKSRSRLTFRAPSFTEEMCDNSSFGPTVKFGHNIKTLFRWTGSTYRLVWKEFIIYTMAYIGLSIVYDFALDDEGKKGFEDISAYCSKYTSSLPIILLLGFFTSTSMQRWFSLVHSMPGTTRVIASFVMSIKEGQPEGYQIVEQYSRWIVLGWALTFRLICKPLKRVFPTLVSLENAGLLLPHERLQLESELAYNHPIVVVQWNLALLKRCNRQGLFMDFSDYQRNQDNLMTFKKSCGDTIKFAAKNIPFALIQAVTITVYSYGLASLMARQLTDEHTPTSFTIRYFPVLNAFQYFLYYLWLQFGRLAAYPFSDDENDIDIKRLLQAHVDDAVRWQSLYSSPSLTEQIVAHSLNNSSHEWMNLACPKAQRGLISEPLANGNNQESALM